MPRPLISVIVPIYGVERYLRQCVDSILAQSLTDIEIILVDDGSPDTCPAIVDEYAARDPRIVAVHQPNGGYGKAVNHGISLARAPYIGIIESDDWIEPTMYEKLYNRAQETGAEWVRCMHYAYNSQEKEGKQDVLWAHPIGDLRKAPDGVFTLQDWDKIFLHSLYLWAGLYKAELIRKVPLIETAGASYQDGPFMIEIIALAKSISIVKEPLVHYRREPNQGSSSTGGSNRSLRVLDMSETVQDIMTRYGLFEKYKEACYYRIFTNNMWGIDITAAPWKEEYYQKFRPMAEKYAKDPDFHWQYFSPDEKWRALTLVSSATYADFSTQLNFKLWQKIKQARLKYPKLLLQYRRLQLQYIFSLGKYRQRLKKDKKALQDEIRVCRNLFRQATRTL